GRWIRHVNAGAQYAHGATVYRQRTAMRGGVDAERHSAHDGHTEACDARCHQVCGIQPMLGRAPRADDGNRRVLEECESPAREQDERWIVELQQSLGIAFVPARDHGEVQLFDRIEGTLDPALGGGRYLLIAPCGLERGLRAP